MQKLIIIRGNSGSGKSTVAKKLRQKLGPETMLISQDVVRRDILGVKDYNGNPTVQLIHDLAMYGKKIGFTVMIEGILKASSNSEMLKSLAREFDGGVLVYYFDVPFEETLRRHDMKPNKDEFGEEEMQRWWIEKDYLGVTGEVTLDAEMSEDEIVEKIYTDCNI
ncbi:kinase [Candidatus Saccharibacteria bacterium]|jgi:predicted kinase|nr:kinase [Candidatus Saccharibacteria bacterium]